MSDGKWPTWLISYNLDGAQWSMTIVARDADDAMRRLKQAATWGKIDGEVKEIIPVWRGGFLIPIKVWLRNRFRREGGATPG